MGFNHNILQLASTHSYVPVCRKWFVALARLVHKSLLYNEWFVHAGGTYVENGNTHCYKSTC